MEVRDRIEGVYEAAEWEPFQDVLYHLGVNWNYEGFGLTLEAAIGIKRDEFLRDNMKAIYVDVAWRNQTSPDNVRRDISTLIQVIWKSGNRKLLEEMSGRNLTGPPACREFLWTLVDEIKRRESK